MYSANLIVPSSRSVRDQKLWLRGTNLSDAKRCPPFPFTGLGPAQTTSPITDLERVLIPRICYDINSSGEIRDCIIAKWWRGLAGVSEPPTLGPSRHQRQDQHRQQPIASLGLKQGARSLLSTRITLGNLEVAPPKKATRGQRGCHCRLGAFSLGFDLHHTSCTIHIPHQDTRYREESFRHEKPTDGSYTKHESLTPLLCACKTILPRQCRIRQHLPQPDTLDVKTYHTHPTRPSLRVILGLWCVLL